MIGLFLMTALFLTFYKIEKNDSGRLTISARDIKQDQKVRSKLKQLASKNSLLNLARVCLILVELGLVFKLINPIQTLIEVRASQLIPNKFTPIARFAANMDWETQTISMDASMSKAFQDKVTNYIWRIDDGTSLIGSRTFKHQFQHPGYYYIQLSIVDADNQSDVATCQILIPPKELEQITTKEHVESIETEANQQGKDIREIDYQWAPKGTFFNYSKMNRTERDYANLKSHYIESGCGYSNKRYNTVSTSYTDFFHNPRVQDAMTHILRVVIIGLVVVPTIFLSFKRLVLKN
jgi:hypothetical protein